MEHSDMTLGIPRETLGSHYIFKSGFRETELAGKREVVKWKEWGEERETDGCDPPYKHAYKTQKKAGHKTLHSRVPWRLSGLRTWCCH